MFLSFVKIFVLILCLQNVYHVIDANDNKVKISLLYESLCPGCREFITTQLYKTYSKIGADFINLEMVPYGHVKDVEVNGTKTKSCQHGPEECYGNKVHGCTLEHNSISDSLGFIYCCESSPQPVKNSTFEKCAKSHNISWKKVESCLNSDEAETIFEKNGKITNKISPEYVPYVIFNGVFNETLENAALEDLSSVVCDILEETNKKKPSVC